MRDETAAAAALVRGAFPALLLLDPNRRKTTYRALASILMLL